MELKAAPPLANRQQERTRPPVKWAGGKGQLLPYFESLFPNRDYHLYIEPFVGGGAVFFHLQPQRSVLIDSNFELINFYRVVKDNLEDLLADLARHKNSPEYYYQIRAIDVSGLSRVERASRFLYLNKTGYNGLWRVNRKGKFNVPFGRYKNPNLRDEGNLRRVQGALQGTEILHGDFFLTSQYANDKTFIYFDPPYHPLSTTAKFTNYTAQAFDSGQQARLARLFRDLDAKGCLLMLSNSDTPLVRELYSGFSINRVFARRAINCKGEKRGQVAELVIRNYE